MSDLINSGVDPRAVVIFTEVYAVFSVKKGQQDCRGIERQLGSGGSGLKTEETSPKAPEADINTDPAITKISM